MLATHNAVWGSFLVFMTVWWLNDAMQAAPVMLTLGYLPLLEPVARLTFSLLVKIVNVGRCGSHQPLSQLQCEAPEKQEATHSTSKTTPKLLSLQTHMWIACYISSVSYHSLKSADPLAPAGTGHSPAKSHLHHVLLSIVPSYLKSSQRGFSVMTQLEDITKSIKISFR